MRHEIEVSEFSAVIQEFAAYKSAIQGCSQRTVEEYLLDLRTFFRYLLCREDTEVLNDPERFATVKDRAAAQRHHRVASVRCGAGPANKLCARLEIPKCKTMPEFLNTEVGKEIKKLGLRYELGNIKYIELQRGFVKICRQYFNSSAKEEMDADFQKLYTMVIVKSDSPKGFSYYFKFYQKQFISLDADFKSLGTTEDAVTLSTIHSAKGLEWDCVIMPSMCDHLFPDTKRQDDVNPDERVDGINTDKKLLFVAVTRSKKDLIISYPCMIRDSRMQARPSRLLGNLLLL